MSSRKDKINHSGFYVDSVKEEADLYMIIHCKPGDFVITQDIGLASILLKKEVIVLFPRGEALFRRKYGRCVTYAILPRKGEKETIIKVGSDDSANEIEKSSLLASKKSCRNMQGFFKISRISILSKNGDR